MRTSIWNRLALAIWLVMASTSISAEPAQWKLWPFGQAAPKTTAPPPMKPETQPAPVVTPATYQSALSEAAKLTRPAEPFPLPPGAMTAEELYRQTDADVMRKSWGCVNCHQGVHDMHDLPTVKLGCCD